MLAKIYRLPDQILGQEVNQLREEINIVWGFHISWIFYPLRIQLFLVSNFRSISPFAYTHPLTTESFLPLPRDPLFASFPFLFL